MKRHINASKAAVGALFCAAVGLVTVSAGVAIACSFLSWYIHEAVNSVFWPARQEGGCARINVPGLVPMPLSNGDACKDGIPK